MSRRPQIVATLPPPPRQLLQPGDLEQLDAWLTRPVPRAWDAMRKLTAIQSRTHGAHGVTTAFVAAMDAACQPASARVAVNVAVEACARAINAAPQRKDLLVAAASTIAVWFAAAELFNLAAHTSAADLVMTHIRALQAAGLPHTAAAGPVPSAVAHGDALAASGQTALARLRVVRMNSP